MDTSSSPEAILSGFFQAAFTCLDENPGFYRLTTSLGASVSAAKPLMHAQFVARTEGLSHVDRLVRQLDAASGGGIDADRAKYVIGARPRGHTRPTVGAGRPRPGEPGRDVEPARRCLGVSTDSEVAERATSEDLIGAGLSIEIQPAATKGTR